jgi:tripartite ATP-independent transporter DctP family solute receptor
MRELLRVLALFVAICLLAVAGFSGISYAAQPEVTLRYSGNLPIGNHLSRAQLFFAKRVDEISKGRVKVEVYQAGQLFSAKEYPTAVPSGAVDMAQAPLGEWTGLAPVLIFLDLPFYYDGFPHVWRMLDAEAGETLNKEVEKLNVKNLAWMQDAMNAFVTKFPLKTLEDLKGKKIRVYSELMAYTARALGAAPTLISGGEFYMAVQRGTVDGGHTSVTSIHDRKFFEICKYVTEPGFLFPMYGILINRDKWNKLPSDIQKFLLEAAKETRDWGRNEVQKMQTEILDTLQKKGMTVYYLPKEEKVRWRKACEPVYDTVIKKAGDPLGKTLMEQIEKVR